MKAPFVPWYIEIEEKNTCLQSPIIALKYIKNSAWAILKLYRKTGVRKGLLRVIYTTIASVTQAQFSPMFKRNSRLKIALWYKVSPNESTFRERSIILITHRPKKNGVNNTPYSQMGANLGRARNQTWN